VITAPRATFAEVAARPKILGILLLTIVVAAVPMIVFLSTGVGQEALLDMQIRQMESFGVEISDQMYDGMQRQLPYAPYFQAAGIVVMVPLMTALTAGVIIAVFNAGFGGNATFKQVAAITAHAGFVPSLSSLFTTPLNFARGTMGSATNLAVFAPFLEEGTFPARLLGMIDLFYIWWAVTLAIGVGVLYQRRTAPIAWGFLSFYLVVVLAIAGVMTTFFGA
jgi:hypothetical protein